MKILDKIFTNIIHSFIFFIFLSYFSFTQNSAAQTIDSMYYGWTVYEYGQEDDKKCYIAATPYKSNSSYTSIRQPYLAITRYSKDRLEEISVYAGYEYKISSDVYLLIDDKQNTLFTHKDMAWAKNDHDDKRIISEMLKSKYVRVRSDSAVGNYAIDEYSMKGLTRAYARMKELCR